MAGQEQMEAMLFTQALATRQLQSEMQGATQTLNRRIMQEQERTTLHLQTRTRAQEEKTEALTLRMTAVEEETRKLTADMVSDGQSRDASRKARRAAALALQTIESNAISQATNNTDEVQDLSPTPQGQERGMEQE